MTGGLVAFLSARIDEDSAWEADHAHFGDGTAPEWVPPFWTRIRKEVRAKRRILDLITYPSGGIRAASGPEQEAVVRMMAEVYADHPDYQPEWRVT